MTQNGVETPALPENVLIRTAGTYPMTIIRLTLSIIALAAFALSPDAEAGVYKCVDTDGSITYTQTPCPNQVTTAVTTSSRPAADDAMDCKHANQFALTVARSMKGGRASADSFAHYGGFDGLSKSAINIINYVYVFQHSSDVSADRIAALTNNKCKARSFGLVNCETMPYGYIEQIGGCDQDDDEDSPETDQINADDVSSLQQAQALAERPVQSGASETNAATRSLYSQKTDDERRSQCKDKIQSEIDGINTSMRSGYSSAQGEQYREQLRTLRNRMSDC